MGVAVAGKKIIYLYRLHSEAASIDGAHIAFVTENGRTKSKDADSTATKDGSIRTPGAMEQEISCSAIMTEDDLMIEKMEDALDNDSLLDIWEVNMAKPADPAFDYIKTRDTALVSGKTYYTRSGSGSEYTYTPVESPTVSDIANYYEKVNKYEGRYFQGYVTEIEQASNAEDMVEMSYTFGINGKGAKGDVTVTNEIAEAAEYAFADSLATGA